jgi:hypothetical protein
MLRPVAGGTTSAQANLRPIGGQRNARRHASSRAPLFGFEARVAARAERDQVRRPLRSTQGSQVRFYCVGDATAWTRCWFRLPATVEGTARSLSHCAVAVA